MSKPLYSTVLLLLTGSLLLGGWMLWQGWRDEHTARALYARFSSTPQPLPSFRFPEPALLAGLPTVDGFDYPMGNRHGALTYNAQRFGENNHLGDDFNGIGGQNSDLGDDVRAIGHGQVLYAGWAGEGWGNVVIIVHAMSSSPPQQPENTLPEPREIGGMTLQPSNPAGAPQTHNAPETLRELHARRYVQSFYGHLHDIHVQRGQIVQRGERIGTVGNARGLYLAHLHFEIRDWPLPHIGPGYRPEPAELWLNPTEFIERHRAELPPP
jgi:hypothetical protein